MEAGTISARDWSRGVRRDPEAVRRGAVLTAWALADDEAFASTGYQGSNEALAGLAGLAPNTVKNSLLQLRALGHVAWSRERIDGADVRTLRPAIRICASSAAPIEAAEVTAMHVEAEFVPAPPVASVQPAAILEPDAPCDAAPELVKRTRRPSKRSREAKRFERAQELAEALPWPPRCGHDGCGVRADLLCADDGTALCAGHRRHAAEPFALVLFGLGRR